MADPITAEDLKAAGLDGEAPGGFVCPECGKSFETPNGLRFHNIKHLREKGELPPAPGRKTPASASRERAKPSKVAASGADAAIAKVVDKTVENLITVGGFVAFILPRTGTAIAGVPGRVDSRARLAGSVLFAQAKANARILELLERFNGLFEGGTTGKIVADLAAAVASDLNVIDPHFAVQVGPLGEVRPIEILIGDVLEYVEPLLAQPEPPPYAAPAANGSAPVTVEGDVTQT